MKTKRLILFSCFALLSLTSVGTASAAADKTVEHALWDLDARWSAAAAAKDLDKTVSYYSDDAIVLAPNMAGATTKEAIRNLWKDLIASASSVSWKATRVEVAKSGDMAYLSGTYEVTMNDGTKDRGKYIEVWEKQADGTWKCGADAWNSDLPIAPAEKK
jgi:ketosteroid isomerase-like protein